MTNHKLRRTIENHDFYAGAKFFRLWWLLAIHDIRSRYRGSVLGPFWITLTTIVMVSSVFLFDAIFKQNPETYLPMFAFGLIFWHFISANVAEGSQIFISYASVLGSSNLPYSVQIYRMVFRNMIVLAHNLLMIPLILIIFGVGVNWSILLFFPAFFLTCANAFWFALFSRNGLSKI